MTNPPIPPSSSDPYASGPTTQHQPDHRGDDSDWWSVDAYCRFCGARPALQVSVRAHQGLLMVMRFHTERGPYCQTCGTAVIRELTTKTLCQGWWSPFSLLLFTPLTLVQNFLAHRKIAALRPAGPPAPGATHLRTGKPIHRRPWAYVALLPLAWLAWAVPHAFTVW